MDTPSEEMAGRRESVDPDVETVRRAERAVPERSRRMVHYAILALIAAGGAVGAVGRWAVLALFPPSPSHFPWSTFWVNVTGSALLGFVLLLLLVQFPSGRFARPMVATGVIGAYTTFSTYAVEADTLLARGHVAVGVAYLGGSVLAGLAAVWAGMAAARWVLRTERWLASAG
ncbi:MAG: CrcB family protein [Actinomycetota bacterium]|nr:CrcB family protein [Actinomycetota bacterium]